MQRVLATAVVVAASATVAPLSSTLTHARHDPYQLVDQAFILGPTGTATPGTAYFDTVVTSYLDPNRYTGGTADAVALTTPEQFSGVSYSQGEVDVIEKLAELQQNGGISASDPVYLFGYSQSSTILSAVDSHLNDPTWMESVLTTDGGRNFDSLINSDYSPALSPSAADADAQSVASIDPSDIHVVLVGDPAADPGDGVPGGFDNAPFTQFWLQLAGYPEMMGVNTDNDLSPTDVYTVDGDNWAQASQFLGIPSLSSWQHLAYLGLDAANFTPLDTVGNTDYFNAADGSFNVVIALADALGVDLGLDGIIPV
ncbi:hypothetical protein [Mycobacterium sp.]|uniref:hypothetical protein n=1 Tax=Mycobacterium sp. TaxID=1785 RepID=UPI0031D80A11